MLPTLLTKGAYEANKDVVPVEFIVKDMIDRYTINKENFFILESKTGSGKSTTLMDYLHKNIFVHISGTIVANLQPRVISTETIPQELDGATWTDLKLGTTLGYLHGNGSIIPTASKSLLYYSYGSFLYRFINNSTEIMLSHSAIVLDEIHELSFEMMILLQKLLEYKSTNKKMPLIIVTSATMDIAKFYDYLHPEKTTIPYSVSGIQFPKYSHFLKDSIKTSEVTHVTAIKDIVNCLEFDINTGLSNYVAGSKYYDMYNDDSIYNGFVKDVLIFVSSEAEINIYKKALGEIPDTIVIGLSRNHVINDSEEYKIAISTDYKKRRIILGTNVAEIGITLPELGTVINLGWNQTMFYLGAQTSALLAKAISKASYMQKIGRVGRKSKGLVFNVFHKEVYDMMQDEKESLFESHNICNVLIAAGNMNATFIESITPYKMEITKSELNAYNVFKTTGELTNIGQIFQRLVVFYPALTLNDLYLLLLAWTYDHSKLLRDACAVIVAVDNKQYKNQKMINVLDAYNKDMETTISFVDNGKLVEKEFELYKKVLQAINDIYGYYNTYNGKTVPLSELIKTCYSTNVARSTVIIKERKIYNNYIE